MVKLAYNQIQTCSGSVGYATCGSGPSLILIVGYTGTLFHWSETFVKELANNFTVYLIDNRKIGLSDSSNEETLKGFAQDVAHFIDAKKLFKPIIFGWSMGGVIAQELARNYEDQIGALVLMATVPNMQVVNPDFNDLTRNSDQYTKEEYKAKLYYYFFSTQPTPDTKGSISKNAVKLLDYHYRFNHEARELQHKIIPAWGGMNATDYEQIKLPVLVLWAKDDLVVPFASCKFISENINISKLIVYPAGGHFMIQVNPKQIALDVINFFQYKMKEYSNV